VRSTSARSADGGDIADGLAAEGLEPVPTGGVGAHARVPVPQLDHRAVGVGIRDQHRRRREATVGETAIVRGRDRLAELSHQAEPGAEVEAGAAREQEVVEADEVLRVLKPDRESEVAVVEFMRAQHAGMLEGAERLELELGGVLQPAPLDLAAPRRDIDPYRASMVREPVGGLVVAPRRSLLDRRRIQLPRTRTTDLRLSK
jgi:hypothetical protein